ncbi:DUF7919 family protein [Actinacidiphila paucisporea]|uniref:DUF7919 domain-containing protein n=1 Tax=Actinacidiphila paucisporea TaxID=310782 RepID=A0A1M6ZAW1_9ACTN|nr:hypothetical protein [Actinacidiphila paucisporea]SHL27611.1 hypothetical protein SAMN05216499_103274 [Actinacidiphila paucisporea]
MATYSELAPYTYLLDTVPPGTRALTVGWLGEGSDFPEGEVPRGFLDAFISLARDHPSARTRGWHACPLPHEEGVLPYPYRAEAGDGTIALGSAEVRVRSASGDVLVAPDLAYHYVKDHHYLPPGEFIEAVMAKRHVTEHGS